MSSWSSLGFRNRASQSADQWNSGSVSDRNGPSTRDAEEIDFAAAWVKEHYKDECFIVVERGYANEAGDGICIPFCWASGNVTLRGTINSANAVCDFELGSHVPIYGYQKLCSLTGSLRDGIVGTYDCGAGSGMVTMFHKGRDCWVDVSYKSAFSRVDRSSFIVSLPKEATYARGASARL